MSAPPDEDRLDFEVLDAVAALFTRFIAEAEDLAREFGIPTFAFKALHLIDAPLAMKDLGTRMRCDPSFITCIADTLERHGLGTRESDPGDRRVKRLVLTPAGVELRTQMERRLADRMPWRATLSRDERTALLALLRKMSPPLPGTGGPGAARGTGDGLPAATAVPAATAGLTAPPPARPRPHRRDSARPHAARGA